MPRGDRGGKSKGSGTRCVAANCGNTHADGISMHRFPLKNVAVCRQWTDFVRLKRAKWDGPSEYSALCADHFKSDCFPFAVRFQMEHTGAKPKRVSLNPNAIPSIHSEPPAAELSEASMTPSRQHDRPSQLEMLSPSEECTSQVSPPKRLRRAYVKRETARILDSQKEKTVETCTSHDTIDDEDLAIPFETEENDEENGSKNTVGCQVNVKPKRRSKHCQTYAKQSKNQPKDVKSVGCQTDESQMRSLTTIKKDAFVQVRPSYFQNERKESASSNTDEVMSSPLHDKDDPDYEPESPASSHMDDDMLGRSVKPVGEQSIYMVYEEQLLDLFANCSKCSMPTSPEVMYTNGTLVKIKQICNSCHHERLWFSQPFVGGKPAGNVAISAGILFSGSVPTKVLKVFKFMNVACISTSTYMRHQKYYLFPAVASVWHNYQKDYTSDVLNGGRSVVLGGDGRADTPGHSAKYGSYSMLDLEEGVVVDVQLVQSNEVKSSCHMEKEGLRRSVNFFTSKGINVAALVTDRHLQINKWVRENMTDTIHYFDVWHVAKGLKKKLLALSKEKDCAEIQQWIKSITNHLYWTAASTTEQNGELMKAKWTSLANHIINVHTGHSAEFVDCAHGDLEGQERRKKWMKPGTKMYEKLQNIITSKQMMKDVPKLSPGQQTSCLEGFHSVINQFAPKMIGFSFHGMYARLWLAALHFNENAERSQSVTKEGEARYRIIYPKFKKGGYTVRKIPVESTYDYVKALNKTVFRLAELSGMNEDGVQLLINVPPPLCSEFERPNKDEAILAHSSRFNRLMSGNQCSPHEDQEMSS